MPRPHRPRGASAAVIIAALLLSGGCAAPSALQHTTAAAGEAAVESAAPSSAPVLRGATPKPAAVVDTSIRYQYPAANADPAQNFGQLYLPPGAHANASVPVVVLIHGGGWKAHISLRYLAPAARSLQAAGVAAWSIEYRRTGSGGGWPTTFTDVASAIDDLPALAALHPELDTRNITLVGHSAGGELAAWAATRATLPDGAPGARPTVPVKGFVSISGVLDMRTSSRLNNHVRLLLGGDPSRHRSVLAQVDPIERIDPKVPSLIFHGTSDTVVPMDESVRFVRAVRAAGGRSRLVELPGSGHAGPITVRWKWWPTVRNGIVTVATKGFGATAG